jgi:carotenoid cleavage dioxygenase-like enzyme
MSHVWRDSMMDFPMPQFWRWTIDTVTGKVTEEQVDDRAGEFPKVADAKVGLKHRYGYMMAVPNNFSYDDPMSTSGAILKYDRETGTRTDIDLGRGRMPGEPVFVPAENAKDEDDGYLMTFVYDASTNTSEFVVMDAKTMSDEPIASVALPRVPHGFHGSWVDASVAN